MGQPHPLVTPGRPRSSLQMLAVSPDTAVLCASIGTTLAHRSGASGPFTGSRNPRTRRNGA